MKPVEAEKLLGGYATGTLTESERQALFVAALEHQEIFDALADEEALRELLADPASKAQLLAALAPAASKVRPFWRRLDVLGAAASLLVAATAGLVYLRSPEKTPPPLQSGTERVPAVKSEAPAAKAASPAPDAEASTQQRRPAARAREVPVSLGGAAASGTSPLPAPPPEPAQAPQPKAIQALSDTAAKAPEPTAKKAEAVRSAAAVAEVVASPAVPETRQNLAPGVPGGVVGGVVGGVATRSSAPAKSKEVRLEAGDQRAPTFLPTWTLDLQPDGTTAVRVKAPRGRQVVLLKRGSGQAEALTLRAAEGDSTSQSWRVEVRLGAGDALDLYVLAHPVADPAALPETGPVDGFRARIHPSEKKTPAR
ncbi:MAG TPA: hypothetical protein VJ549_07635 [Geothrix sp.]|nr:hypothetical protein [Geothrix sp.]